MRLRPYQQKSLDLLYEWFKQNESGHPCIVLPTAAGKSVVIAELVRYAVQNWPESRILMLTHVKELIEQNAEKMLHVWPDAPVGIYSAGIGRKELSMPITFAGIQSVRNKANELGHIDLVLVDEAHLINTETSGTYRKFIGALEAINPYIRIVGLTATPFRLGSGYLTNGDDALFTALIEPTSIAELVEQGYLAKLRSKHTANTIEVKGIKKEHGEFAAGMLEDKAMQYNSAICSEVESRTKHCRSILVFAAGVKHAEALADMMGGKAITVKTPKKEREKIIADFKSGTLRTLTNANVLTTGFNHPDLDCIIMARPTMSPTLYLQMVGRGMRLKSHTDHCLVLDFAGNVARHGPITDVKPPKQRKGGGDAPIKTCPGLNGDCLELIHASIMTCPVCGYEFPRQIKTKATLHADDIMGLAANNMVVNEWAWRKQFSSVSGKPMIVIKYYSKILSDPIVTEHLCVAHDGYAGDKARGLLAKIANSANAPQLPGTLDGVVDVMNFAPCPSSIQYKRDGKFFRVLNRSWE